MKKNLTQMIEDYLLNLLHKTEDDRLEIRRIDLAEELGCAPSQITYVLSTRFTMGRGFSVESRRGNGGFVRIEKIEHEKRQPKRIVRLVSEDSSHQFDFINGALSFDELQELPYTLWKMGVTSEREAELLHYMLDVLEMWIPESHKKETLAKEIFQIATRNHKTKKKE